MIFNPIFISELEEKIGYQFIDHALFMEAFTHPSSEPSVRGSYQRLEFLGDEVVGLGISVLLFKTFQSAEEGKLSKARSNLIDEQGLALIARKLELGKMLVLGKGEERMEGREKDSILADTLEALMAVIFLEAGWERVFKVISTLFFPIIEPFEDVDQLLIEINRDHKTRLQEIAQELELPLPLYQVIEKTGPDHNLVFVVECTALGLVKIGKGKNKKTAEQSAAEQILLEVENGK
ncbi:MAG: ribonuclease III [bacterium]